MITSTKPKSRELVARFAARIADSLYASRIADSRYLDDQRTAEARNIGSALRLRHSQLFCMVEPPGFAVQVQDIGNTLGSRHR
jgi:hypothetical protein